MRSHSSRTPARYPGGGIMIPAVPGMDSSTMAAIVAGPSSCDRLLEVLQRALALLLLVVAWNADRYRYGPKKWTMPSAP